MKNIGIVFNSFLIMITVLGLTFLMFGKTVEPHPSGQKINWLSIDEAQELSRKSPRKVFVDVYTVWCGPCKLMERTTFSDPRVVDYVSENYYAVKLNAESRKQVTFNGKKLTERELAEAFRVQGYPTIVLIDEDFETVSPQLGYMKAPQFRKLLIDFNQK